MFFKTPAHKARFLAIMQQLGQIYDGDKLDQEYGAALYILTADAGIWQQAQKYVERHAIHIDTMLEKIDLSSGYRVLVLLAGNLFNGEQHVDPLEFMRLDDSNFLVAMTALQVRRLSLHVRDLLGESEAAHE